MGRAANGSERRSADEAGSGELTGALLRRLSMLGPLSEASRRLLDGLEPLEDYGPGRTIRLHLPARCTAVGSGWAARYRLLSDGRRQIVSLILPGDMLQCGDTPGPETGLPLIALTEVRLLNAHPVRAAAEGDAPEHAGLRTALARAREVTGAQLIDQIVRLGQQNGLERMAHLFAELQARLCAADVADDIGFSMPLTQECLADILGLSMVHVNRTLQQLRRQRLIELAHGRLRVLRPARLTSLSDYQPAMPAI